MYTPSEQAISFWHPGKDKQYQNLLLRHVFHQIQASNRLHTVQRFFNHGIIHKRGHQFKKFGCWGVFQKITPCRFVTETFKVGITNPRGFVDWSNFYTEKTSNPREVILWKEMIVSCRYCMFKLCREFSSTITKRRLLAHNSVTAPLPPDKKQKEEKWRLRFNNLDLILLPVQSSAIYYSQCKAVVGRERWFVCLQIYHFKPQARAEKRQCLTNIFSW